MTGGPKQPPGTEAYGADRIALHLLGATQAAAVACIPWVGRGDKEGADGADKPRHEKMIARVRQRGAGVLAVPAGDVMGALRVLLPNGGADLALGVGGTPEGVITACVTRLLDGEMQAKLAPQSDQERAGLDGDQAELHRVLTAEDLVCSGDCVFIATGITSNPLLPAPEQTPWGWRTHSFVVTPRHPGLFVDALPRLRA